MDSFEGPQWGITNIKTVNFSYIWTINNFSFHNKKNGQIIISPTFLTPGKPDIQWYLGLYPKGLATDSTNFISLYLYLETKVQPINISTKIKFSVLNSKKIEMNTKVFYDLYEKQIGYGYPKFLEHSVLSASKNDLLPDDTLTIMCKVTAGMEVVENCSIDFGNFGNNENQYTLCNEFGTLLRSNQMTDITLIADGKDLKAHKAILAARSPVFLRMLETDMQEKKNSKIEFTDISMDILSEMVQYLYTGKVENIKEYACDLVKLADKYDIKGLKLMCEKQFYSELSIESAIKLFILADSYNCKNLRSPILKFIIANAKDVLKTVGFKSFEKDLPYLIKEMIHAVV